MPQVKINEIDQSRYLSVAARSPLIALTPVISSFGPTDDAVLIETESQYDSIFGPQLSTPVQNNITRNYAITLINSGVTLLAKRIEPIVVTTVDNVETIDNSYNVNDITASTEYTIPNIGKVTIQAKYFGSRGNDVAVQFSKVQLNSGALDTNNSTTIYRINTYYVGSHTSVIKNVTNNMYIGTLDSTLTDYVGVDDFTLSTIPTDDNFIGNTTYLNAQLENINITISFNESVPITTENYTTILETLCTLTSNNKAILLSNGFDYFNNTVTDETYTEGTALVHTPIIKGTFEATLTATVEGESLTYRITEVPTGLACYNVATGEIVDTVTATLNYSTGAISITGTGVPTGATIKMNYRYSMDNSSITKQFVDAISFNYGATVYPKTYNRFWEAFSDHYVYDFDVIVSSGFTGLPDIFVSGSGTNATKTSNLHLNMLRLAVTRGDAVALLDTPQVWSYTDVYEYTEKTGGYQPIYSFGAVHAPWCKIRDLSTGNYAMMPASLAFLGAISNGLVTNGATSLWYAPAGVARAYCPNVISAQYEIGGTILNYWQNTQIARVNPIMKILSYGYCVYGNATLMQNMKGHTKSSLQSLGTRFLCNTIKKAIFSLCVRLTFEPNDYNLWSTFRTELGDVLRQYQLNGVISQYEITMDESTVTDEARQNLTVPGKVNIVPTLPAEYFDIDFTISAQGVTFAEQVLEEEE